MGDKTKAELVRENMRWQQELNSIYSRISRNTIKYVMEEMDKARGKYPEWPTDIVHSAAIVAEESGELVRAALNSHYHGEDNRWADKEAIQTIVTAIRFVEGK